jgi:hypothetical protein
MWVYPQPSNNQNFSRSSHALRFSQRHEKKCSHVLRFQMYQMSIDLLRSWNIGPLYLLFAQPATHNVRTPWTHIVRTLCDDACAPLAAGWPLVTPVPLHGTLPIVDGTRMVCVLG